MSHNTGRLHHGLVLVILGIVFLLMNYNVIPPNGIWNLWPVLLILSGASLLWQQQKKGS